MHDVIFTISITPEAYLQYYRGAAKAVIVKAEDGRRIRFPAQALQSHIKPEGIHGRFRLLFDKNNKLIKLEKLSS
ncbi:MAG: DUF2835 domain-containing protein [Gammaproteobacteria bacterium]|nr:DUF2835 domain-containing protein [Gammaproteobacteria bacterium]